MRKIFRKYLPRHEAIRSNRWLRPFQNTLLRPELWHLNRRSAAGGFAIGLFCGLIPGPIQMLSAAVFSVILRVNLPLALVTTLYSNPLTIVPLYFGAYAIGALILGVDINNFGHPPQFDGANVSGWISEFSLWAYSLGKPLLLGLILLGILLATAGYFALRGVWRLQMIRAHKKREQQRRQS